MHTLDLAARAAAHMRLFCDVVPTRQVGSAGNATAVAYFARTVADLGFVTATPAFDVLAWESDGATLEVGGESFAAQVSPWSLGASVRAPLRVVSTVDELAGTDLAGTVVLLRGPLAREQLMPKHFPFYNPDEHQRIIALLEAKAPRAIISATERDTAMAGAVYPFPLFEDGDFDIPSVYIEDIVGALLADHAGLGVDLVIRSQRHPARAENVVARRGPVAPRVVVTAHIDAKGGTPGALDNAAGTTVLLLLAELLVAYTGGLGVEIVAINGEDNYAVPGEKQFLADNAGRFGEMRLGVNLDGLGYREGATAYSLYGCPPELETAIRGVFGARPGMVEGEPWYQGDHMLFLANARPALAITSERAAELMARYIHSPLDRPELVAPERLAQAAEALADLIRALARGI